VWLVVVFTQRRLVG